MLRIVEKIRDTDANQSISLSGYAILQSLQKQNGHLKRHPPIDIIISTSNRNPLQLGLPNVQIIDQRSDKPDALLHLVNTIKQNRPIDIEDPMLPIRADP